MAACFVNLSMYVFFFQLQTRVLLTDVKTAASVINRDDASALRDTMEGFVSKVINISWLEIDRFLVDYFKYTKDFTHQ